MPEKPLIEDPIEDEIEEFKPDFTFIPKGRHIYRQQGPYLICRECQLDHAVYVGMEKIMVGEDEDGTPILKLRSEISTQTD